jgi:hypothetical protein
MLTIDGAMNVREQSKKMSNKKNKSKPGYLSTKKEQKLTEFAEERKKEWIERKIN